MIAGLLMVCDICYSYSKRSMIIKAYFLVRSHSLYGGKRFAFFFSNSLCTESFQGNKLDKKVWQENDIPLKLI